MSRKFADSVATASPRLGAVGFHLHCVSTYGAEYQRDGTVLSFATEPHYPGLSASIKFIDGQVFELGALAEAIDPAWYEVCKQQSDSGESQGMDMMVDFLCQHLNQILHHRSAFEGRYLEVLDARREAFGISQR